MTCTPGPIAVIPPALKNKVIAMREIARDEWLSWAKIGHEIRLDWAYLIAFIANYKAAVCCS